MILYSIYYILTVYWSDVLSVYSNPYQPLRADTEGNGSQARKGTVSRYKSQLATVDLYSEDDPKMINFNWLQFREHGPV